MEEKEWLPEDKEKFSIASKVDFESLPLELQCSEYIISTNGSRTWEDNSVYVPGSSIVYLFNDSGRMRFGTAPDRYSGPAGSGAGSDGNIYRNANSHCFLVGVGPGFPSRKPPYYWFRNSRIRPDGASIGTLDVYWEVGQGEAGQILTAFNDSYDADNSGNFTQRIRICPINVFAKLQRLMQKSFD